MCDALRSSARFGIYVAFQCAALFFLLCLGVASAQSLADDLAPPVHFGLMQEDAEDNLAQEALGEQGEEFEEAEAEEDELEEDGADSSSDESDCERLAKAVASSHKVVHWRNDFSYILDAAYCGWWPGDSLKRRCLGCNSVWDLGGSYRARLHNERNIRGLGLTGRDDDFLLHQTRLFANVEVGDSLRFFAEYLDAESNYENFPPRAIDVNRSDMLNLFGDVRLWDDGCLDVWGRVGRQELIYGVQRLVSPLPWGNTRRNFEGAKVFANWCDRSLDVFWTHPVAVNPTRFDSAIDSQEFMGAYATRKLSDESVVDAYWLRYIETEQNRFEFDTLGIRLQGSHCNWLWDCEGAVQFGDFRGQDHMAGFWVLGGGRKFESLPSKPALWLYYDWASGDETISNGFHHLFPLSHKYLGFMDLFGRRNIEDANVLLTLTPHEKWELLVWWHLFYLQDGDDVPYNVNMTPFTTTVGGSQYLGQELDCLFTWKVNPRATLLLGYSHFFSGTYYDTNPSVPFSGDADFFYTEFTYNF